MNGEAVILGLLRRPWACRDEQIKQWLAALDRLDDWHFTWAPAVVYGLADAPGVKLRTVIKQLKPELLLVSQPPAPAKGLRARVHEFAKRQLDDFLAEEERQKSAVQRPTAAAGSNASNLLLQHVAGLFQVWMGQGGQQSAVSP